MRKFPRSGSRSLLAVLLLLSSQPSVTAQTGPAPAPAPGTWTVNGSEQYCSVGRTTQDAVPITFSVRTVPGSRFVELLLHNPQWRRAPFREGEPARIVANPSGTVFEAAAQGRRLRNGDALLAFNRLPLNFLRGFAGSTEIQVDKDGQTLLRFSYRQAERVLPALQACIAAALRDWGVDHALLESLRSRPVEVEPWLTSDDYPVESLRDDETGQVVVRLAVSESGRVTACNVVASSGHERLDQATCRAALGRARYSPAIGADGRPVAVTITEAMMFEIMHQ